MQRKQKHDLIMSTNGRFFTVLFKKKSGELREMNCRLGVKSRLKGTDNESTLAAYPQYVTVFDVVADDYRAINLDTLRKIKTGGVEISFPEESVA
jgi:hypothetical protein